MENDEGQPAGGAGAEGEDGGAPPTAPAFDRGQLHPALRDMSPSEITDLFETMATTIRTVQTQGGPPARRDPMDDLGVPAHGRAPEPPAPPKREMPTKDQYKEMLDPTSDSFDPERAFRAFAEANYGALVGDINARTIRGLFGTFRTEFEDFKDYEADVIQGLSGRDSATLTERDVLQTYLTAKGLRATLAQRAERAKRSTTTVPPSPPADGKKKELELSSLEEEIAHKMFRREPDPAKRLAKYREFAAKDEDGGMTVSVPVGGGKKA